VTELPGKPRFGLCANCRYGERIRSSKGSLFLLCRLSESDPRFPKYPRLPVESCSGYREKGPEQEGGNPRSPTDEGR
jgi:hypothetical protein